MTSPFQSSTFNHLNYIGWTVQTMKFLIMEPSTLPFSSLLGPNIRIRILFSNTLTLNSSLNVRDHVSQPFFSTNREYFIKMYRLFTLSRNGTFSNIQFLQQFPLFLSILEYSKHLHNFYDINKIWKQKLLVIFSKRLKTYHNDCWKYKYEIDNMASC